MNRTFNINCIRADPQAGICELPASSAGTPGVLVAEEDNVYFNLGIPLGAMNNNFAMIPTPIPLRSSGPGSLSLSIPFPTGNVSVVTSAVPVPNNNATSAIQINNPGVYQIEISAPFESTFVPNPAILYDSVGYFYALMVGIGAATPVFSATTVIGNGSTLYPNVFDAAVGPPGRQGGGGVIVGSQTMTFVGGEQLNFWITMTGAVTAPGPPFVPGAGPTFTFASQTPYIRITRLSIV